MKRSVFSVLFLAILMTQACRHSAPITDFPVSPVGFKYVTLTDSFWLPRLITNRDETIPYGFEMCRETGRIQNFIIAGSHKAGQFCSKYPFDDSDVYKIIEGASYTLATDYNKELDQYLDSLIVKISNAQEKDGYLETWRAINPDKPLAEWWGTAKRWSNLGSGHELYNMGHLYEAAVAHYEATGKRSLLDVALKSANLICETFGPGKLIGVPGHEEIELGLMKLYRVTHDPRYLEQAKFFIDARGDSTRRPIWGTYQQDHMPVRQQREAVGHAVRAGYLYSSMTELSALTGDTTLRPALNAIWNDVTDHKLYITGGVGAKSEGEAFGKPYELPNTSAYAETCAAISMVLWNHRMFLLTGDSKYYDFLERTLYNGLISGIGLNGNSFFYENPLETNTDSTFNEGEYGRQPWFTCACCPSNLARFIPQIPGLIYATRGDRIFINLYISNEAKIKTGNDSVRISMKSDMPWGGKTAIKINSPSDSRFTIALRGPSWTNGSILPGDLYNFEKIQPVDVKILVNGKETEYQSDKGYMLVTRSWKKGDMIIVDFPVAPTLIKANPQIASDRGKIAVGYGPLLYCAESTDNPDYDLLHIDPACEISALAGHDMKVPYIKLLLKNPDHSEATLIPYSLWANRGISSMKVWISEQTM